MLVLWLGEAETITTVELRLQYINTDTLNNINFILDDCSQTCITTCSHFLFTLLKVPIHAPPQPPGYSYFDVVVCLAWSKDPEGYAGGRVATGWASRAGEVKGEKSDETEQSRPPGWGLGVRPTNSPRKNAYVEKTSKMSRRRSGYTGKGLIFGTRNVRILFKIGALPFTKAQTQRNNVTEKDELGLQKNGGALRRRSSTRRGCRWN